MEVYYPEKSARWYRGMCPKCKAMIQAMASYHNPPIALQCTNGRCDGKSEVYSYGTVPLMGYVKAHALYK